MSIDSIDVQTLTDRSAQFAKLMQREMLGLVIPSEPVLAAPVSIDIPHRLRDGAPVDPDTSHSRN